MFVRVCVFYFRQQSSGAIPSVRQTCPQCSVVSYAAEIFRYQQHCVDKYGLKPHIKLRTRITAAAYDEVTGMWTLTTGDGEQETFRVVVMAQGECHMYDAMLIDSCPGQSYWLLA